MKQRAESRAGMTRTSIALDDATHRRLALAALEDNAALTELVRRAVEEFLDRRESKNARRGKR